MLSKNTSLPAILTLVRWGWVILMSISSLGRALTVAEPPDHSQLPPGLTYILDTGVNTFTGTVATGAGGDQQDNYLITVPTGKVLTGVNKTVTGGGFTGFVTFNLNESLSGTGTASFTSGFPLAAGSYPVQVAANFSSGSNWTVVFTVADSPDYTVTTSGGIMTVTDTKGTSDEVLVLQPAPGQVRFEVSGRTFSVNGAPVISGHSGTLSLAGLSQVTVNAAGGEDVLTVGSISSPTVALTLNGGTESDQVRFTGNSEVLNLDANLQNDGGAAGADEIVVEGSVVLVALQRVRFECSRNISLASGSSVVGQGDGVILRANTQASSTAGEFTGIRIDAATVSAPNAGTITIEGVGGTAPDFQLGVEVTNGAQVLSTGRLSVVGRGGGGNGIVNRGVTVYGTGTQVASSADEVLLQGTGGGAGSEFGIGVAIIWGAVVRGGTSVNVDGQGAGATGGFNMGLELSEAGSLIEAPVVHLKGGDGGGGSLGLYLQNEATVLAGTHLILETDSLDIGATAVLTATESASVTPKTDATAVRLGGADDTGSLPRALGLTDDELDRITCAELRIVGKPQSPITGIAQISRASGGLSLVADPLTGSIEPVVSGVDVSLLASATLTLDGPLHCPITGASADSGYPQLRVNGRANLSGRSLSLTGTVLAGSAGQTFRIINNDGNDAIVGTFEGLPQGALLTWPGSLLWNAQISYTGGTGNDVELTLVSALTVSTLADAGPGSLRQALAAAAAKAGADSLAFDPGLSGGSVVLQGELTIADAAGVTVDARVLPGGLTLTDMGDDVEHRLLSVQGGSVAALHGLTFSNGGGPNLINGGGAISNLGTLTLSECTFSGNSVTIIGGAISNEASLAMTHCTLSGNRTAILGGALANIGSVSLTHCTITANTGGGAAVSNSGQLILAHTIVAGNPPGDVSNAGSTVTRVGNNIVQSISGGTVNGTGALINSAPALLPLGNYGGASATHPPRPESPAIDAATGSTAATDQRGVGRPTNGDLTGAAVRDIGAVEFNQFLEVTTTADDLDVPAGSTVSLREAIRDAAHGTLIHFSPLVFTGLTPTTNRISLIRSEIIPRADVSIRASNITRGVTLSANGQSRHISLAEQEWDATAASGTTATQSSQYNPDAHLAADGIDGDPFSFTSTSGIEDFPSWTADFHRDLMVSRLVLSNRQDCCPERLRDITVRAFGTNDELLFVSPTLNPNNELGGPDSISVVLPSPIVIRKVRVSRSAGSAVGDDRVLSLGELRAFHSPALHLHSLTLENGNASGDLDPGHGGALLNRSTLLLERCTLSNNSAAFGGGGGVASFGVSSRTTLRQCTLAANAASFAGALWSNGSAVELVHSTIAANTGFNGTGGLVIESGTTSLSHSIIADNSGPVDPDLGGIGSILTLTGPSLIGRNTSPYEPSLPAGLPNASGHFIGSAASPLSPRLAPLDDYGGPTHTLALRPTSRAINTATGSTTTTDQRGFPIAATADIGAYETGTFNSFTTWIWEILPASATPEQHGQSIDYDFDGPTNHSEWLALSDPANGRSFFTPTAETTVDGLVLRFPTSTGRVYRLRQSESLQSTGPGAWIDSPGQPLMVGDGSLKAFTVPTSAPRRYYTVVPQLP